MAGFTEDDIDGAWETVRGISSGKVTGRNLATRLSAATYILDQAVGKAPERDGVLVMWPDETPLTTTATVPAGRPN